MQRVLCLYSIRCFACNVSRTMHNMPRSTFAIDVEAEL